MDQQTTKEGGRILIVDDNRMNRLKLSMSLEQQGYQVAMAESGPQALDMLSSEPMDVVLLDILMPEMDGHQVLKRMKDDPKLRDIPVIVISAVDEIESVVRSIEMGAEDYLPKSFDPVLLRARLSASLQRKKLRDLEKMYLQQEMMLRQSEKLATLGKLSAGMAHELNNPAAAAQRGTNQLFIAFARFQGAHLRLSGLGITDAQQNLLSSMDTLSRERSQKETYIDSLTRSDRESEIETWLDEQNIENAWDIASTFVSLGLDCDELERLLENFSGLQFPVVVEWINCTFIIYSLLQEISQGTGRISEIVNALKVYSYMDQAPIQNVDIHEGLDNTLVILRSKLKTGVTIHREYAPDLPRIEAFGSELNQVWTNLIDNAIDAMGGVGEITLRTSRDGQWVLVEIEDIGPGIPQEIQSRIFDPFFTTKEPGKGTGMGLNITHNIVVQKHQGKIDVHSQPGRTCFVVRLPLKLAKGD